MLPSASQSTPSPTGEINVLPSIITGVLEALNLYVLNLELYKVGSFALLHELKISPSPEVK